MNDQKFKADAGKRRPSLLQMWFAKALRLVQATLEYGAIKYEPGSWRNVPDGVNRYFEAAERHRQARLLAVQNGFGHTDSFDKESNLMHISHEVFNLLAIMELELGIPVDDDELEALAAFHMPPTAHKIEAPPIDNNSPLRRHAIPVLDMHPKPQVQHGR